MSVPQETCRTVPFLETFDFKPSKEIRALSNDELAGVVIKGFAKIRDFLPYIIELRRRFETGKRNSHNRLIQPVAGCHSWFTFCKRRLGRSPEAIRGAIAEALERPQPGQFDRDPNIAEPYRKIHTILKKLLPSEITNPCWEAGNENVFNANLEAAFARRPVTDEDRADVLQIVDWMEKLELSLASARKTLMAQLQEKPKVRAIGA